MTAAVVAIPVLIVTRQINRPVEQVANALAERRISSLVCCVLRFLNRDREYQKLVAEITDLMEVLRESQAH